eukprot:TRINITY_DN7548_c0_g1_i1.p1 TRINITY_DN7548_c0_g1~~TRINITY_DN7548_c0_g1_i1.p1  ORF type:complete len:1077 (-),score=174.96 TRINITY_DN7548_c0_g1_i1:199-3429(-)
MEKSSERSSSKRSAASSGGPPELLASHVISARSTLTQSSPLARAIAVATRQARFLLDGTPLRIPGGASKSLSQSDQGEEKSKTVMRSDSDSIMGEVQDRMVRLDIAGLMENTRTASGGTDCKSVRSQVKVWTSTADSASNAPIRTHQNMQACMYRCLPRIPFRPAVIGTVVFGALLSCVLMFSPLEVFTQQLKVRTLRNYNSSVAQQRKLIQQLTGAATDRSHSEILRTISEVIETAVLQPPDRAIDALWGTMRTFERLDSSWNASSHERRYALAYRALVELVDQVQAPQSSNADYLYAGFASEQFAGASVKCSDHSCSSLDAIWFDGPGIAKRNLSGAPDTGISNLSMWDVDLATERPLTLRQSVPDYLPSQRPWYALQANMSREAVPLRKMWTELYVFVDGSLGLTRTAPLAFCKNYSCFGGVVASDITLPIVSKGCNDAWDELRQLLNSSTYKFDLHHNNSAIFVVNQVSERSPSQEGLLVGSSDSQALRPKTLTQAVESPSAVVKMTAKAILQHFGHWNSSELSERKHFLKFQATNELQDNPIECGRFATQHLDSTCLQAGMLSVELDDASRWLIVLVSPATAFSSLARSTEQAVSEEVKLMETELHRLESTVRMSAALAFVLTIAVTLSIAFCLGTAVTRPLRRLSLLLRRLSELDFAHDASAANALRAGARSSFRDVSDLEDAFCRLSRGIESFARFVPEAVVRSIIRGEERATRLHVSKKDVTIMFSDIKDFTSISESLTQRDLIFLLTRYLSIMSRIVESFGGTVAEILGDGLLVYWNTPSPVEGHAAQACAGALAMQQALGPLNEELEALGLPALGVRIGLNTGNVLSGTFGSDKKMKFGCMGDPVNLASRLEGLCKEYGVGIVCSSFTYEQLPASAGFVCRKLDTVQVKGKRKSVEIYEVMGFEASNVEELQAYTEDPNEQPHLIVRTTTLESALKSPSAAALEAIEDSRQSLHECPNFDWEKVLEQRQECMAQRQASGECDQPPLPARREPKKGIRVHAQRYEAALKAYQSAHFEEAIDVLNSILLEHPDDSASARLLKLAVSRAKDSSHTNSGAWTGVTVMTDK